MSLVTKIIKDVDNNTIDIPEANLVTFKSTVDGLINPLALKVTPLTYDSTNSTLTIANTANFSGTLKVGGTDVNTKFTPQTRTVAELPMTSDITVAALSEKLGVNFAITDYVISNPDE